MEALPTQFARSIRSYWRRRKYQKLDGSGGKKTVRVTRLGGGRGSTSNQRFWKLRPIFRFRVKLPSPIRLLARLRDAYVEAMLRMAGKGSGLSAINGPDALWGKRVPRGRPIRGAKEDFDQRLILEIYKSLVAAGELPAY